METALLIAAVVVAGAFCPAMMWWQRRSGRASACCAPNGENTDRAKELDELHRSQAVLATRLAELQGEPVPAKLPARDEKALA